jgi:CRP-like cAMP-binding protein
VQNHKKIFGDLSEIKKFKKKEVILKEGDVENYISYNIVGAVAMVMNHNGTEICNSFSIENSYFSSYCSFLTRQSSKCSIIALEETMIERINYDSIQMAYNISAEHQKNGRLIAEQLYIQESYRTLSLISETAEQRYIRLMQTKPQALQRIPLKYLASYLGITPVSLSRLRNNIVKH